MEDPWEESTDSGGLPSSPAIVPARSTTDSRTLNDWLRDRSAELTQQYRDPASVGCVHVPTGLSRLDAAGLLEPGIVTTLLAAAGENKTTWAFQFLRGCAEAGYAGQAYFPEDPWRMLGDRLLAGEIGADSFALRRGRAGKDVPERLGRVSVPWADRVEVDDGRYDVAGLRRRIAERMRPETRLVVLDYLQSLSASGDRTSLERIISEFVWDMGELARDTGTAVLLLSQVRGEVLERGRKLYDGWRFKNPSSAPTEEMVVGYRPHAYDGAWAPTAIYQKSRCVIGSFRPRHWMRAHGANVVDDVVEINVLKSNYGPSDTTMRFHWDGVRISERTK